MNTPERYTAEQMVRMAECVNEFYIPLGARLKSQHDTLYGMLTQAATDATRLQSLEAENARLREALARISVTCIAPMELQVIARNALK